MADKKPIKEIPSTKATVPDIKTNVKTEKYKGGHVSTNPPPKVTKPPKN